MLSVTKWKWSEIIFFLYQNDNDGCTTCNVHEKLRFLKLITGKVVVGREPQTMMMPSYSEYL